MTISNQPEPSSKNEKNPDKTQLAQNPMNSPLVWGKLALAIAVLAFLCGLYLPYKINKKLNLGFEQLHQQKLAEHNDLAFLKTGFANSQSELNKQFEKMNSDLRSALQQSRYQQQDWLLLKARYYLELAQINAYWSQDQQTTLSLLKTADDLLSRVSGQELFPIRQAIAEEITQVQSLPKIDLTGLLSRFDAAEQLLDTLTAKQPLNPITADQTNQNNSSSSWRQRLQDNLSRLEKLVVIKHYDKDAETHLSPFHQILARDIIRLNLKEAQWALLQNNSEVYRRSLIQALKEINSEFDSKDQITQTLINQLKSLQQANLSLAKPKLDKALPLLNSFIDSKNTKDIGISKEGENLQ